MLRRVKFNLATEAYKVRGRWPHSATAPFAPDPPWSGLRPDTQRDLKHFDCSARAPEGLACHSPWAGALSVGRCAANRRGQVVRPNEHPRVVEVSDAHDARGESPSGTERERPDAQDEVEARVEQDLRR